MEKSMVLVLVVANAAGGITVAVWCRISIAESMNNNYIFMENALRCLADHNDKKHIVTYEMLARLI
jgi:hypothetical protein